MKLYQSLILSTIIFCSSCEKELSDKNSSKSISQTEVTTVPKRIPVLNFGTFHMGRTSDANKTVFDEYDKENQRKVHEIVKKIASFKPTVIIVERTPEYQEKLELSYNEYLKDPEMFFKYPSEIELLGFELGRLSDTKRIYGIDHRMGYNYNIGNEMDNKIDATCYGDYSKDPFKFYNEFDGDEADMSLLEKLKLANHDRYLDFLITINADILTYVGSEKGFEGADEATKYYQRNLRMYANLNRIELTENDRVFILMGASHTAFFRDFISRSPKYKMVDTFEYLK